MTGADQFKYYRLNRFIYVMVFAALLLAHTVIRVLTKSIPFKIHSKKTLMIIT